MIYNKEDYNSVPVHYCKNCLSLNIKELNKSNLHVCGECGNVNTDETDINDWTEMYTKEYGRPFLSEEDPIVE